MKYLMVVAGVGDHGCKEAITVGLLLICARNEMGSGLVNFTIG